MIFNIGMQVIGSVLKEEFRLIDIFLLIDLKLKVISCKLRIEDLQKLRERKQLKKLRDLSCILRRQILDKLRIAGRTFDLHSILA